ncbi:Transposable element [Phytophthora megakarya]|uniref:Transposable element n=1 Tax=Phytophthora megakarya TaxID=4795 RepID=A0A225VRS7_9STRA|nr:Transposable element [Phytophthora megakarya]
MGREPPILAEERAHIEGLHESGLGVREIAGRIKRSPDGVSYVLRSKGKQSVAAGRPKSLTYRQIRQIVRGAATGNYSASGLKAAYGVACSVRTIQRLLAKVDSLVYS